jgi:hypothetical protein
LKLRPPLLVFQLNRTFQIFFWNYSPWHPFPASVMFLCAHSATWNAGHCRWSLMPCQLLPSMPVLSDILIWITPFFSFKEHSILLLLRPTYQLGPDYRPLWFYKPWSSNLRHWWGFDIPSSECSTISDIPLPHQFLHFAWQYLTPADRAASVITCSQWFYTTNCACVQCKVRLPLFSASFHHLDLHLTYHSTEQFQFCLHWFPPLTRRGINQSA